MDIEFVRSRFIKHFDGSTGSVYASPGRINLIGEHTDYNGGHVFPCALSFGTYGAISLRGDKIVRMYSENFVDKGIITFNKNSFKLNINYDSEF